VREPDGEERCSGHDTDKRQVALWTSCADPG